MTKDTNKKPRLELSPEIRARFREYGRIGGLKGDPKKKALGGIKGSHTRWKDLPRCAVCRKPLSKEFRFKGQTIVQTREMMKEATKIFRERFPNAERDAHLVFP